MVKPLKFFLNKILNLINFNTFHYTLFYCQIQQKQLSFLMIFIILNLKFNILASNTFFSKCGGPKTVFITSKALNMLNILGVTPITCKGLLFGGCSSGKYYLSIFSIRRRDYLS